MKGSIMESTEVETVTGMTYTDHSDTDPYTLMTDRELAETTARNTQSVLDAMTYIKDTLEPALAKLGPVMAMMGLG